MGIRVLGFLTLAAIAVGSVGCTLVAEERPHREYYDGPRRDVIVDRGPRYRDPVIVQPGYAPPPPPPPVYVQPQQPVYVQPQPDVVVVQEAPPPIRIETRPPRPWNDGVWIDGYWNHGPRGFVWVGGRWDHGRPGHQYVAPRWDRNPHGGFEFHGGGWH